MPIGFLQPLVSGPGLPPFQGAGSNFLNYLQGRNPVKAQVLVGTFAFDYAGEARVDQQVEITDHVTENNSTLNDNAVVKPLRLVLRGFVAELAKTAASASQGLGSLQSALTTVPSYLGKYTPGAVATLSKAVSQVQNIQNQVNQAIAQGNGLVSLFGAGTPGLTTQQKAYARLSALKDNRVPFNVVTPYDTHKNMLIESLVFVQPEDTKDWSDITVTLKQVRFVTTIVTPASISNMAGRLPLQAGAAVTLGGNAATTVTGGPSFLAGALGLPALPVGPTR